MGKLTYIHGVMDAGKTNALLTRAHGMEAKGYSILTVKSDTDFSTKGNRIESRVGLSREADIILSKNTNLRDEVLRRHGRSLIHHVLGEEGQFWTPEQIEQSYELAVEDNIDVTIYGLKSDFQRRAFPASVRLFELANPVETLEAPCRCTHANAAFNARKVDGEFVFEGDQVAVDNEGDVTYESLCPSCYQTEKRLAVGRGAVKAASIENLYQVKLLGTAEA